MRIWKRKKVIIKDHLSGLGQKRLKVSLHLQNYSMNHRVKGLGDRGY